MRASSVLPLLVPERQPGDGKERRILDEYLAAMAKMTIADARELMRHGIPIEAIAAVCPAPAAISIDRAGALFRFDEDGARAFVLPVCAVDPDRPDEIEAADPLAVISRGPVIDLLAFSPAAPRRCALRLGTASVLGAIEPQYLDPEPLPVWRDVIGWLRAGCRGLVLLTNDPFEACSILQRVTTIAAEDEAHKRKLEKLLAPPRPTTTSIAIGRVERRAA